jgi:predicted nucleic acid-binding protein
MEYIVDTYAWVEYLIGSERGKRARDVINDGKNRLKTLSCCIGELKGWCLKEHKPFGEVYRIVQSNSDIEEVYTGDWIRAAEIRHIERKSVKDFGFIDSVILAKQEDNGCRILTGDQHLKKHRNVTYIGT